MFNSEQEYYCVLMRRPRDRHWLAIHKFETRNQAELTVSQMAHKPLYRNGELRVISRTEAKQEFGKGWEYRYLKCT